MGVLQTPALLLGYGTNGKNDREPTQNTGARGECNDFLRESVIADLPFLMYNEPNIPTFFMRKSQMRSSVLYGMLVGIVMGAGTVFVAQGYSLTAALVQQVSYREVQRPEPFKRRDLSQQQQMEARRTARQTKQVQSVSSVAPASALAMPALDVDCAAKVQIVLDLKARVLPLIPARPIDLIVYDNVLKEFDRTLVGCAPVMPTTQMRSSAAPMSAAAASTKPAVDPQKYCAKYTGSRRTQCLGELEKNGILY